ncbi:transposase domain-containing protein, partial [Rhodoferax ferrireducens]|uniref:transposase domain-containing protein n=1 Tax=Rhodoferax ferrireducens TaxID=192843 RepID=UPI003BB72EA5
HATVSSGGLVQRDLLPTVRGTAAPVLIQLFSPRPPGKRLSALWKHFDNRNNWLFAGSLRAGKRGAAVMSLIQSARLNGHDPFAYLKDVLTRLPTQRASQIHELLPHRWQPQIQFT